MMYPLAFGMPGPLEWILIAGVALLIFGKRLPEVGRSLGRGIVEFKKGLKGVEDELEQLDAPPEQQRASLEQQKYKFDPYTGKPVEKDVAAGSSGETRSG